jgi:hypothetical protein
MDGFDPNFRPPAGLGEPLDEEIKIESKESIKVICNSKGFNWEVKVTDKEDVEKHMDRLDRIIARLQTKYPKTLPTPK